ncbi:MAG: DUF6282 family protein [Synergistaceae bacterium]|nr:DUF6282 family protein [Synergistaceae bacterium]
MGCINEGFEILEGTIDIHIHSGPDIFPRLMDDLELAEDAKNCGMSAILIKNHATTTADRAIIASKVSGFQVYGGVVLNNYVGGLNPEAVKTSLVMGAKQVWLPTIQSREYLKHKSHVPMFDKLLSDNEKPLYLLDDKGELKPEVYDILDLVAEHKAILGTGHISFEEALPVTKAAHKRGIDKVLITHPVASFVHYSYENMKEILDAGAAFLEHVYNDTTPQVADPINVSVLADAIKKIGPKYCIMSTDGGQVINPKPTILFRRYINEVLELGISRDDVDLMTNKHPQQLLTK